MSNEVQQQLQPQEQQQVDPVKMAITQLRDDLSKMAGQFQMVLPAGVKPEAFTRIVLTMCGNNPDFLLKADRNTLLGAAMTCAQLRLSPDPNLQQAYFVPYWNKTKQKNDIQLQIGYRGKQELARRSGQITDMYTELVYKGDIFKITMGTKKEIIHQPSIDADHSDVNIIGAYAVAHFENGRYESEFMNRADLLRIRNLALSKATKPDNPRLPWNAHFGEMCRKTVFHRLAKYLPQHTSYENNERNDYNEDTITVFENGEVIDLPLIGGALTANDNEVIENEPEEVKAPSALDNLVAAEKAKVVPQHIQEPTTNEPNPTTGPAAPAEPAQTSVVAQVEPAKPKRATPAKASGDVQPSNPIGGGVPTKGS